jgi:hypothetical protein
LSYIQGRGGNHPLNLKPWSCNYDTIYTAGTSLEKIFISIGCAPRKKIVLFNPVIDGGGILFERAGLIATKRVK